MEVSLLEPKVELAVMPRVPDDFLDLFMASARHFVTRKSRGRSARRGPEEIGERGSSCRLISGGASPRLGGPSGPLWIDAQTCKHFEMLVALYVRSLH